MRIGFSIFSFIYYRNVRQTKNENCEKKEKKRKKKKEGVNNSNLLHQFNNPFHLNSYRSIY